MYYNSNYSKFIYVRERERESHLSFWYQNNRKKHNLPILFKTMLFSFAQKRDWFFIRSRTKKKKNKKKIGVHDYPN